MALPKMGGKKEKEKEKKNCGGEKKMLRPQHFSQQIIGGQLLFIQIWT